MLKIEDYPFYKYANEDKSGYTTATEAGYVDPDNDFLIGESGGFLLNLNPDYKFINTYLFRPAALAYKQNKGKYTVFNEDSLPHKNFRKQEEVRRIVGYKQPCRINIKTGEILEVRITGEHYNFINYCPILQLDESSVKVENGKVTGKKHRDFPLFIDCQYYYYKIKEFCSNNGFHLINDKTRRGGFSYMEGTGSAHYINIHSNRNIIHAAVDNKYLIQSGGLSDFMKKQLIFYETETPFKRGIAKIAIEDFILGYKSSNGTVDVNSWNSAAISVSTFNKPDAAIGKDAGVIKCEELSMFDNFDAFMDVTEPTLRTGSVTTGFLNAWGTAGSASSAWQVFEKNFYSPKDYNFLPFENVWDKDCRTEVCGYFKPYCWGLQGFTSDGVPSLDKDGNSDIATGYLISNLEREQKRIDIKVYSKFINYCGQYANMPSESFSSVTENAFSREELDRWEERLKLSNDYNFYVDGKFIEIGDKVEFLSNERAKANGGVFNKDFYSWISNVPRHSNEHPHGCIRKWFNPIITEYINGGKVTKGTPPGLYSISYDPVGINKSTEGITMKHSHNSIKVWMNPSIYNGYRSKLVMAYYGRPETLEEADRIAYCMSIMYNCVGTTCVETNRGETVSNFKRWKLLKNLKKNPVHLWDNKIKGKIEGDYGIVIGDGQVKLDAIRLTVEMLYEEVGKDEEGKPILNLHNILDYQTVLELKKWNEKGNFDRVSELLVRGVEWAAMKKEAIREYEHKKYVNPDDIFSRDWY